MPALQPNPPGGWVTVQQRFVGPWLARLPLDDLPAALQAPLLGTPVWKLLLSILLGLAILAVVLHWWGTARRWTAAVSLWRRHALMLTVPGLLAALVVLGHGFIMWQVVPAHEIANAETILTTMVLYLAAAWAAVRACWLLAEVVIASPAFPDSTYDAHLVRIVARVGSLLAAGTIIVYGANDIGVPALGLLAGVSIGGIALALAAQSTVENLLGGITIFADRPFRVGDEVSYWRKQREGGGDRAPFHPHPGVGRYHHDNAERRTCQSIAHQCLGTAEQRGPAPDQPARRPPKSAARGATGGAERADPGTPTGGGSARTAAGARRRIRCRREDNRGRDLRSHPDDHHCGIPGSSGSTNPRHHSRRGGLRNQVGPMPSGLACLGRSTVF